MKLSRVVLFVRNMRVMLPFYRDVLEMLEREVSADGKWAELGEGDCTIALHAGGGDEPGKRAPKLVFDVEDVAQVRAVLVQRGAAMGKVITSKTSPLVLCDGKDPEGNVFQLSNRTALKR